MNFSSKVDDGCTRKNNNACEIFITRVYRDSRLFSSLNRTTTVTSTSPLYPLFSSWLATIGPTSWAGTSFLSDAISLHRTGPHSPAWRSSLCTPSRSSSLPSSFVPSTIVSSAGGRPTIESEPNLPNSSYISPLTSPLLSGQPDGDMAYLIPTTDPSMWHTLPPSPPAKRTKLAKISTCANVLLKRLPLHHHPRAGHLV